MMARPRHRFETADPLFLDDDGVERVLAGEGAVAPVYLPVSALFDRLRQAQVEPGDEQAAVATMLASVRSARPRRRRAVAMKITAAGIGIACALGGTAAAATGNLPDAAQGAVANTVAHVGIALPEHAVAATPASRADHRETPPASSPPASPVVPATPAVPPAAAHDNDTHAPSARDAEKTTSTLSPHTTSGESHQPAAPGTTGAEHRSATGAEHAKDAEHRDGPPKEKSNGKSGASDGGTSKSKDTAAQHTEDD
jgi:hypothetical protein